MRWNVRKHVVASASDNVGELLALLADALRVELVWIRHGLPRAVVLTRPLLVDVPALRDAILGAAHDVVERKVDLLVHGLPL